MYAAGRSVFTAVKYSMRCTKGRGGRACALGWTPTQVFSSMSETAKGPGLSREVVSVSREEQEYPRRAGV